MTSKCRTSHFCPCYSQDLNLRGIFSVHCRPSDLRTFFMVTPHSGWPAAMRDTSGTSQYHNAWNNLREAHFNQVVSSRAWRQMTSYCPYNAILYSWTGLRTPWSSVMTEASAHSRECRVNVERQKSPKNPEALFWDHLLILVFSHVWTYTHTHTHTHTHARLLNCQLNPKITRLASWNTHIPKMSKLHYKKKGV